MSETKFKEVQTEISLTEDAKKEIVELTKNIEFFEKKDRELRMQNLYHEARAWNRKWDNAYQKKDRIEKEGISTKERTQLLRLIPNFEIEKREEQIAGFYHTDDDYIKVGIWNGKKVRVYYKKWTNFMRNVQGCASLAGRIDFKKIEVLEVA